MARVVVVTPWGERLGGAESMLWTALNHLDRSRIEPVVVFLGPGGFEREVAEAGILTEVVPSGRLRRPDATVSAIRGVAGALRRHRPDLIVSWSAKAQLYVAGAASLTGMRDRVVWWQHMVPDGHWIDRLATLTPARAVGCSSSVGRNAQAGMRPRRRTFVVNPGIDPRRTGDPRARARLRAELEIAEDTRVLGIVGRLQPWKGQDRFLAAVAQLRARGHDVHGLVVGGDAYGLSPEYASGLRRLVRELGLERVVSLTGQVPDAAPYIGLMDVAVNASETEPFGIVLIEAMAAEVPAVAVGCGGPLDIIEPGISGMLASNGSPGALADAIEPLLADPALRDRVARGGRARYLERFTAERMTEALTGQLLELAHEPRDDATTTAT